MICAHGYWKKPWVPEEVESFIQQHAERYRLMSFDELELKAFSLIEPYEKLMDQQSIVLYAVTNVINPKAVIMLSSSIGSRSVWGIPEQSITKAWSTLISWKLCSCHSCANCFRPNMWSTECQAVRLQTSMRTWQRLNRVTKSCLFRMRQQGM